MRRLGILLLCAITLLPLRVSAQPAAFDLRAALAAATPGATVVVPPGIYAGPLQITKPVVLVGQEGAIIDGGSVGDVITIQAPDVTIRGFTIRNSGASLDREHAGITGLAANTTLEQNRLENVLFGIYLKNTPGSVLRNNLVLSKDLEIGRRGDGIRLWYCDHCVVEGNTVHGSRDVIIWYAPHTIVRNNVVEESRYGLHFMSTDDLLVENNIVRGNSVGIYVMYGSGFMMRNNLLYDNRGPSGYGLGLKDVDNFVAEGNRLVNNRVGLYADIAPRASAVTARFTQNLFAYNEIGVMLLPLVQHNFYSENIFQDNHEQVTISGRGELVGNGWSAGGRGNYWSDYAGFDADANGIGDLPYRVQSLYEDLLQNYPELRLFQLSPATQALDMAAKAFPIFQPKPKLVDEHPLTTPPLLVAVPGLPTTPLFSNLAATVALLLFAGAILWSALRKTGWQAGH